MIIGRMLPQDCPSNLLCSQSGRQGWRFTRIQGCMRELDIGSKSMIQSDASATYERTWTYRCFKTTVLHFLVFAQWGNIIKLCCLSLLKRTLALFLSKHRKRNRKSRLGSFISPSDFPSRALLPVSGSCLRHSSFYVFFASPFWDPFWEPFPLLYWCLLKNRASVPLTKRGNGPHGLCPY